MALAEAAAPRATPSARAEAAAPPATPSLVSHKLPSDGKLSGAAALLLVLFTMILGPLSPVLVVQLLYHGQHTVAALILSFLVWPFVVEVHPSPWFSRLYLRAAGYFDQGVTVWFEERVIQRLADDNGSMWCLHPHGTSVGLGFTLNGAVRYKADQPHKFLPAEVRQISICNVAVALHF